jgi:predicted permease
MQPAQVLFASGAFFSTLGLDAALGRTFTPDDDVRGGGTHGPVTVISFDTWQRQYAGAADVIGRHVTIGRALVTIVGVAPRGFLGVDAGQSFDFAVPLGIEPLVGGPQSIVDSPRTFFLTVMLRRREGQSIEAAQVAAEALKREILATLSASPRMLEEPVVLVPAATGISDRSRLRQQYEQPIVIVGVIAACVLVVGCLNLANLLLARTAAARADLGIRFALGGSRWRIARLVIAEGALLVGGGAALGLPIALTGSRWLASSLPLPAGPVQLDLSLDWSVAAFGLTAAIVVLALCSLLPAILASRVAPIDVLKPARPGGARALVSGILVIVQVAVSAVLVLGAGMFVGTAVRLAQVPLGFDADRLTVVTVDSARIEMRSEDRPAIFDRIVSAAQALPGAGGAAGSIWTPLSGQIRLWTDARGRQSVATTPTVFNFVTPGWFAVYGTPIVIGRDFRSDDHAAAARVAIVNEAFVEQVGTAPAVGQPIDAGPCGDASCTIVGVAADARYTASPRDPVPPTVYIPLAQSAGRTPPTNARVRVTIREAPAAPAPSFAAIASAVRSVDPRLTFLVQPLSADVARSMAQERLLAALATVFGALALLLAGLGIYGVTSYAVGRRRVELAIRSALGADRRAIVALVAAETARRLAVGLAVGLAAAVWLSQFVTSLLFGVDPISASSALAVVATLGAVGAVAAWAPARRAARTSPTVLFRS